MQSLILYLFTPGTLHTMPVYTCKFDTSEVKDGQHSLNPVHALFASTYTHSFITGLHTLATPMLIQLTEAFSEQGTALQTGENWFC